MTRLLTSSLVLFASAALFLAGVLSQADAAAPYVAPTSLSLIEDEQTASGPTIPPGPWDEEEEDEGGTKVASGPTIPPGPWDEEDEEEGTKVASGPTIPPGPWDEEDEEEGGTKIAAKAYASQYRS